VCRLRMAPGQMANRWKGGVHNRKTKKFRRVPTEYQNGPCPNDLAKKVKSGGGGRASKKPARY